MKRFKLSHWAAKSIDNTGVNFIDIYVGFVKHNIKFYWKDDKWFYGEEDEILYKDKYFSGPVKNKEFINFLNKFGVR